MKNLFFAWCLAVTLSCGGGAEPPSPRQGGGFGGFGGGGGSGGSAGGGASQPCDGTPFCSSDTSAAVCINDRTTSHLCGGKTCAAGRCGACRTNADCRFINYRCRCADGTEKTGTIDGVCGDSQGL